MRKLSLSPENFRLEPEGSQIVTVGVKAWSPSDFITDLSVIARPLDINGLIAAPGIKVPIAIEISAYPILILVLFIIGVCFLAIFMIKLKNKNKGI